MPAIFDKLGIRFQYPENWTLDEQDAVEGNSWIAVYSPGGGFWSVVVHPIQDEPMPVAEAALQAMRQVYDNLDSEPVEEAVAGHPLVGYDLNFYCLDLTNTALIRSFRTPTATLIVLAQADDREFDEISDIFRAITISLVSRR